MSSVDSTLNSASTLVLHDFVLPKRPNLDSKKIMKYGRVTTFVLMTIAACWAPLIGEFGGLYAYLQQSFAILVPPVVIIYLMGIYTTRGTGSTAFYTLFTGHMISLALFLMVQFDVIDLHFTINAGITTFLCLLTYLWLSRNDAKVETSNQSLFRKEDLLPEDRSAGFFSDYRTYAFSVLALITWMLIAYW